MWLRKIQNFVAIRCCAQKILLAYNPYAARQFLLHALFGLGSRNLLKYHL